MRNAKKLLALILTLAMSVGFVLPAFAANVGDYKDSAASSSYFDGKGGLKGIYEEAVQQMLDLNVITGTNADPAQGDLNLASELTRIQFMVLLYKATNGGRGIDDPTNTSGVQYTLMEAQFSDMKDHWGKAYANWAFRNGVSAGDGSGKFNPDSPLSLMDALLFSMKAIGLRPDTMYEPNYNYDLRSIYTIASTLFNNVDREFTLMDNVVDMPGGNVDRGTACVLFYNLIRLEAITYNLTYGTREAGGANTRLLITSFQFTEGEFVIIADGKDLNLGYNTGELGAPDNGGKAVLVKANEVTAAANIGDGGTVTRIVLSEALTKKYGIEKDSVGHAVKIAYRKPSSGAVQQVFSWQVISKEIDTFEKVENGKDKDTSLAKRIGIGNGGFFNTNNGSGQYAVFYNYSGVGVGWLNTENGPATINEGSRTRATYVGGKLVCVFVETYTFARVADITSKGKIEIKDGAAGGTLLNDNNQGDNTGSWLFQGYTAEKGELVLYMMQQWAAPGAQQDYKTRYVLYPLDEANGKVTVRNGLPNWDGITMGGKSYSVANGTSVTGALANFAAGCFAVNEEVILYTWQGKVVYGKAPDSAPAAPDEYALVIRAAVTSANFSLASGDWDLGYSVQALLEDGTQKAFPLKEIKGHNGAATKDMGDAPDDTAGHYGAASNAIGTDLVFRGTFAQGPNYASEGVIEEMIFAYNLNTDGSITLKEVGFANDTPGGGTTLSKTTNQYKLDNGAALANLFLNADTVTFIKTTAGYKAYKGANVPAVNTGNYDTSFILRDVNTNNPIDYTTPGVGGARILTVAAFISTDQAYDSTGLVGDWVVALADGFTQVQGADPSKVRQSIQVIDKKGDVKTIYSEDGKSTFNNVKKGIIYEPTYVSADVVQDASWELFSKPTQYGYGTFNPKNIFNTGISAMKDKDDGYYLYDGNTIFVDVEAKKFITASEAAAIDNGDYLTNYIKANGAGNKYSVIVLGKGLTTAGLSLSVVGGKYTYNNFVDGGTLTFTLRLTDAGVAVSGNVPTIGILSNGATLAPGALSATDVNGETTFSKTVTFPTADAWSTAFTITQGAGTATCNITVNFTMLDIFARGATATNQFQFSWGGNELAEVDALLTPAPFLVLQLGTVDLSSNSIIDMVVNFSGGGAFGGWNPFRQNVTVTPGNGASGLYYIDLGGLVGYNALDFSDIDNYFQIQIQARDGSDSEFGCQATFAIEGAWLLGAAVDPTDASSALAAGVQIPNR